MSNILKIRNTTFKIPKDKHIFNADDIENSIFSSISNIEFYKCSFIWDKHNSDDNFWFINLSKETVNTSFYHCYFLNPKKSLFKRIIDYFAKKLLL